jgi:hypothetical protein
MRKESLAALEGVSVDPSDADDDLQFYSYDYYKWNNLKSPRVQEIRTAFKYLVSAFAFEELLAPIFGDHVEVVATRDGITTSDHDHD